MNIFRRFWNWLHYGSVIDHVEMRTVHQTKIEQKVAAIMRREREQKLRDAAKAAHGKNFRCDATVARDTPASDLLVKFEAASKPQTQIIVANVEPIRAKK